MPTLVSFYFVMAPFHRSIGKPTEVIVDDFSVPIAHGAKTLIHCWMMKGISFSAPSFKLGSSKRRRSVVIPIVQSFLPMINLSQKIGVAKKFKDDLF